MVQNPNLNVAQRPHTLIHILQWNEHSKAINLEHFLKILACSQSNINNFDFCIKQKGKKETRLILISALNKIKELHISSTHPKTNVNYPC